MSNCIIIIHGRGLMYSSRRQIEFEYENAIFEGLARVDINHDAITRGDILLAYYAHLFEKGESCMLKEDKVKEVAYIQDFASYLWETAKSRGIVAPHYRPKVLDIKHDVLAMLDMVPGVSGLIIYLLKDIYEYFTKPQLRNQVKNVLKEMLIQNRRHKILLMAYSLGTIVSYEVLSENPDLQVHTLMTFGSPLGVENTVKRRLSHPPKFPDNVTRWLNYYDDNDIVSADRFLFDDFPDPKGIKRVEDIRVFNDPGNHHSITSYFSRKRVAQDIKEFWKLP